MNKGLIIGIGAAGLLFVGYNIINRGGTKLPGGNGIIVCQGDNASARGLSFSLKKPGQGEAKNTSTKKGYFQIAKQNKKILIRPQDGSQEKNIAVNCAVFNTQTYTVETNKTITFPIAQDEAVLLVDGAN